jgi:rhodanese-related sulfurtransferase
LRRKESVVPTAVTREELHELIHRGAQLVEVLPEHEYDEEHLPGAVHLPLKRLTADEAERVLDRARPVVVYCWDAL